VESVRGKLFKLPNDTLVYPGHGGFTSIEHEKKYNYFV
jgi:glyoxylase-like metal-dependent hydrolase (beta-lactamase superfamily II)